MNRLRWIVWNEWTVVAVLAVVIFGLVFGWSNRSCHQFGDIAQVETRWDVWSGCYLQVDGEWVPRDLWRFNEGTP